MTRQEREQLAEIEERRKKARAEAFDSHNYDLTDREYLLALVRRLNAEVRMTADIIELVAQLLNFPHPKVCKHYVAANLLSILEKHGVPVSDDLAKAVVDGDDDKAKLYLEDYVAMYPKIAWEDNTRRQL